MTQQQEDIAGILQDIRRLVVEREQKKRELDAIDRAISLAVGIDGEDRPKKPRFSRKELRMMCGINRECVPAKKRHAVDSGMA